MRLFMIAKFDALAQDLKLFETRTMERAHMQDAAMEELRGTVKDLEPLKEHVRDIHKVSNIFDRVKQFVTEETMTKKMEQAEGRMGQLRNELNVFTARLDEYLITQEHLKANFDGHVGTAFQALATECKDIRTVVNTLSGATGQAHAMTEGAINVQITSIHKQLERAHTEIDGVKNHLKEALNSRFKCHCEHLDLVEGRVAQLETCVSNLSTYAAQQSVQPQGPGDDGHHGRGLDPWSQSLHGGHHRAFGGAG